MRSGSGRGSGSGNSYLVGMSPVCPPASPPCAHIKSAPAWQALWTCWEGTQSAGESAVPSCSFLGHLCLSQSPRLVSGCTYLGMPDHILLVLSSAHIGSYIYSFTSMRQGETHHVQHACLVQLLNRPDGRYADGRDEELGAALNDDVDELGELAFGVVVLLCITRVSPCSSSPCCPPGFLFLLRPERGDERRNQLTLVFRAPPPTCGSSKSTPKGAAGSRRRARVSASRPRSWSGV